MERVLVALAFAVALGTAGCANEGPTGEELQEQVARGFRGEGTLTPGVDRSDDPHIKSREGAPLPRE